MNASNLSRNPPWPGMIFPESFTPKLLFSIDSIKSPTDAKIDTKIAKINQFTKLNSVIYTLNNQAIKNVIVTPHIEPSHVLLGDILGNSGVFPI